MEQSNIEQLIARAREYNESLVKTDVVITDPFDPDNEHRFLLKEYESMLNIGNDILCYVEIPCINVYLPVYHGTSDDVLQKGAGHIEGTSIPIGGESTHSVIAAHSGLNNAKMFTDLEKMYPSPAFNACAMLLKQLSPLSAIWIVLPDM